MNPQPAAFRGVVLGLRRGEVERVVKTYAQEARISYFSPLLSLALGLGGKTRVQEARHPPRPYLSAGLVLVLLWGSTSSAFFVVVLSFLLDTYAEFRWTLILVLRYPSASSPWPSRSSSSGGPGA